MYPRGVFLLFRNKSVDPDALFDKNVSDDTLGKVKHLYTEVDGEDRHSGIMRGDERKGNCHTPGESAVKDEGKKCLSSRAECEIYRVSKGEDRHCASNDDEHRACHFAGVIARVVESRDQVSAKSERGACDSAGCNGEGEELPYRVLCIVDLVRAEVLTEDDRDRATHREADYVEEVENRGRNIRRRNTFKSAYRVALKKNRLTEGPEKFVEKQGRSLDDHILAEREGDLGGLIKSDVGGIFILSCVGDDNEHCRLDESRDNGCDRRALYAHRSKGDEGKTALVAEDKEVVENEVYKDSNYAADHGKLGFAFLTEGRAVDLRNCEGRKTDEHYVEVVKRMLKHKVSDSGQGVLCDIELKKRYGEEQEDGYADDEHRKRKVVLCSNCSSYACAVLRARELRGEDSDSRKSAEDTKVEDEEKLINGCNRGHFDLSDSSDHNVVNEADGIGEGVLNYDWDENGDDTLIKRAVADKSFFGFEKHSRHYFSP